MAEPFFTETPSDIDQTVAFNWYGSEKTWADSHKYILNWLSDHKMTEAHAKVKALAQHEISWVCGWICRLQSQGSKVTTGSIKYRDDWLASL